MPGLKTAIVCYISPAGNNKIADWHNALSIQGRADADTFIANMMKMSTTEWKHPHYKVLTDARGLGELRWLSENKQHRLLGFFHKGAWNAVVGCTKKQNVYAPANALNTAQKYKDQIEMGTAQTVNYDL